MLVGAVASCGDAEGPGAGVEATRETTESGVLSVRYEGLPDSVGSAVEVELRIGALEGDSDLLFGDVRGLAVDGQGSIYVLDFQGSDIRVFGSDGAFRGRIASHGEGPGELTAANGMVLRGDTTLWVQDHGKMQFIRLRPDGTEVERLPMHVLRYGYVWSGTVDLAGRLWKTTSYADVPRPPGPPEPGWIESTVREYYVSFDPASELRDSVYLGEASGRTLISRTANGFRYMAVPFVGRRISIVDPDGGIWLTDDSDYRIVHLDSSGDTVLVLEADAPRLLVTEADRDGFVARMSGADQGLARDAATLVAEAPEFKPAITEIFVDDGHDLWVRRNVREQTGAVYDRFGPDGTYRGSVRLAFTPVPFLAPVVRDGKIYAVVRDELDVQYVVRGSLRGARDRRP